MLASNQHLMSHTRTSTVPDDDLLPRIAAGDDGAFTALFHRHQAAIYRFALHMTGRPEAADDVTQEVFLAVMRDARRYQAGRSSVIAWLCGIARNFARRRIDAERAHEALDEHDVRERESAWSDPVDGLHRAEEVNRVRTAVLSLPVRYREALVLCDLQEFSYAEAAVVLGCAIGTVRSRLHRARALLAVKLRGSAETDATRVRSRARGARCFA